MSAKFPHFAFLIALGLVLVALPFGPQMIFTPGIDVAHAEKGGNGNGGGNSGGNGNAGGGNASSTAGGGNANSLGKKPEIIEANAGGSEQSQLGRWNAAKPYDHPAIQAHILNGNFKGTIGMVAAYHVAQQAMDEVQDAYALPAGSQLAPPADLAAAFALATTITGVAVDPLQTTYTADEVAWAAQLLSNAAQLQINYDSAVADLTAAEETMDQYSNREDWAIIRATVRTKMGLADENDLL